MLRPLTSRLPDEQQPFGLYASGKSVRRIHSELEASHTARMLAMAARLASSSQYDMEAAAMARMRAAGLPQAKLKNGLRAGVRMYVSTVEIRGNMLVADGFDNQVVVLRMGEDEADDDDDDDGGGSEGDDDGGGSGSEGDNDDGGGSKGDDDDDDDDDEP